MEISREARKVRCRICGGDSFQASGTANWKRCHQCDTEVCPRCYRNELKNSPQCTAHEPPADWLTSSGQGANMVFK